MTQNLCKHLPQCLAKKTRMENINYLSTSEFSLYLLLPISHTGSSGLTFSVITRFPVTGRRQTTGIWGWGNFGEESFRIIRIGFMTLGKATYSLYFSFLYYQNDEKTFSLTCLRNENKCANRESNGLAQKK